MGPLTERQWRDAENGLIAHTLTAPDPNAPPRDGKRQDGSRTDRIPIVFESRYVRNGRGAPDSIAPPLKAESGRTGKGDGAALVALSPALTCEGHDGSEDGRGRHAFVGSDFGVRRLTPVECERLQGFPDGWTDGQSDSARYRQLGNAVAVPKVVWLGRRIAEA